MTALERLERLKVHYPLCPNCKHAKELITTLACKITGKVLMPKYPKYKCPHYEELKSQPKE